MRRLPLFLALLGLLFVAAAFSYCAFQQTIGAPGGAPLYPVRSTTILKLQSEADRVDLYLRPFSVPISSVDLQSCGLPNPG